MCCSWPCRRAAPGRRRGRRPSRCRRPRAPEPGSWGRYGAGPAFLEALAAGGRAARGVDRAARAASGPRSWRGPSAATLASGRGALVVVPDGRAAARVDAALDRAARGGAACAADRRRRAREAVPAQWLAVQPGRGAGRGRDPGRDVRAGAGPGAGRPLGRRGRQPQRAARPAAACPRGAAAAGRPGQVRLPAGRAGAARWRPPSWSRAGWARPLVAEREQVRAAAPLVRTVGDGDLARDEAARAARLPTLAWQAVREGLRARAGAGAGAAPGICAAAGLRTVPDARALPALRGAAGGAGRGATLRVRRGAGARSRPGTVPECGGVPAAGPGRGGAADRGGAGPGVSGRPGADLGAGARAGHGAGGARAGGEHAGGRAGRRGRVRGGAAAGRLGHARAARSAGRGGRAAALDRAPPRWSRPQADGGTVVVVAEPTLRPVQALVRWDPVGHAVRELAERAELGFPPVSRMAAVSGPGGGGGRASWRPPNCRAEAEVLGPVPLPVPAAGRPGGRGRRRPGSSGSGRWSGCRRAGGRRWPPRSRRRRRPGWLGRERRGAVRVRIDPPDIG